MPRLVLERFPSIDDRYSAVRIASHTAEEANDCAIKAVAIATEQTYDFIRGIFYALGRGRGDPTRDYTLCAVINILGGKLVRTRIPRGATTITIAQMLPTSGDFLIWSKEHVSCVSRGRWYEFANPLTLPQKILKIYRVMPSDFQIPTCAPSRKPCST